MSLSEGNTLSLGKSDAGGIERRRTARRACSGARRRRLQIACNPARGGPGTARAMAGKTCAFA
ncbi:hypothetical protein [Paraburkholderia caballeronis]|uniref:hypothetical protein n=1 Tax=Paraburkholderia caballeronis TaxID=416943 RepID=UPI00115F7E8E|nr:hypothetical protein [Paraburkholderia caballeronis]